MKKICILLMLSIAPAWAIDLNTASLEEIAALKGMSRQTAEAIVTTRYREGPFLTSSDVLKVPGVTQGILNQNRATLTIAGRPVTTRSGTAPAIPGVRAAIPAKKAEPITSSLRTPKDKKTSPNTLANPTSRESGKNRSSDHRDGQGKGNGGSGGGGNGGGKK